MDELDEIIKEFLVESYENLDQLDRDLVLLEDSPDDANRLSSIFRTIHTIKGTCGFLGFPILEHVTHVGESLLVKLRDGELRLDPVITTGLLVMVDAVRTMLSNIETAKTEGENHYETLVAELEQLQLGQVLEPASTVAVAMLSASSEGVDGGAPTMEESVSVRIDELEAMVSDLKQQEETVSTVAKAKKPTAVKSKPAPKAKSAKPKAVSKAQARSQPTGAKSQPESGSLSSSQAVESTTDTVLIRPTQATIVAPVPLSTPTPNSKETIAHKPSDVWTSASVIEHEPAPESADKNQAVAETTVRLDVTLLDKLMNLVGELVLVRNQILQYSRSNEDPALNAASQRLNLITTELQEGVMKTRMQPIQNAWAKLPRVVRDVSVTCGKKVQIKMEGAETELDKTILEAIRDPLTHIVRNSVDHGIETPEVRKAIGKPVDGTLLLRAYHEGGQVNIEISDDGAGINLTRVKEKAISQGLITSEQAASMSDRELMNLILLPGFSTAATVTNVSGRGVGMDVVKTNVEKIGGTLDIQSVLGEGTTLRIKIPLTLAIVPALMVSSRKARYAIPQNNLVELVRLEGERVQTEIEHIHDVPVYRLRGNLLPLLFLDEQLNFRTARTAAELKRCEAVNIVVLNAENRKFGLVVDDINDTQEIVVKPLNPQLKDISTYAGVTIMGNGTVALILDVLGIAKRSGVISEARDRNLTKLNAVGQVAGNMNQTLLLMGVGKEQRMAIPLSLVARLEEISASSIELADGQQVVQYGGQIMPLIHLGDVLNSKENRGSRNSSASNADGMLPLQVVVYSENGRSVGLVVDQILDIVETTFEIQHAGKRIGVLGSAVIQNRVTDLLDIHNLILSTDKDFFATLTSQLAV
ncbi:MAG: chemotaxis protein CheA [Planctomycetota bacterium]